MCLEIWEQVVWKQKGKCLAVNTLVWICRLLSRLEPLDKGEEVKWIQQGECKR